MALKESYYNLRGFVSLRLNHYLFSALFIISCLLILFATNSGFALDEGGCLICHQYPGLVRLEEHGKFRPLHIDEEKYVSSPHGKFKCNQCHINVNKVPHTGETRVDCSSKCHKGKDSKILPADYPLDAFHRKEQSYIAILHDESSCRVCHPLYPHSKNNVVRAFLNLHAGFMFCDVCHIKKNSFDNITYEWKTSEDAEFIGKPFGTFYNPKTGEAQKGEHFISRIAAFTTKNGEKQSLMNTWDTAKAEAFTLKEKSLEPDEKMKELAYYHKETEEKEISVACNECHSTNSILDFDKLGFDDKKTKDLIYLNIKGLVTKYKTFYFPKLFGD
jgi:hypothetical protein